MRGVRRHTYFNMETSMKLKIRFGALMLPTLALFACSQSEDNVIDQPNSAEKIEIKINAGSGSRATDYGFETNDCIGLYVVNYNGSTPGTLLNTGNHVDNMRFTYNGLWTPDKAIYWKDAYTHADFYLYYPYSEVTSVTAHTFTVKNDQSTEVAYKSSDFMVGKALDLSPTAAAINIPVNHIMSRVNIHLAAGNGFTEETLAKANISIKINGIKTASTVNLASGMATPTGEPTVVTPYYTDDAYQAIIVPQTVEEGNLFTVNVDGKDYNLKKAFTFVAGKSHKFTVTISKISSGVNVNINPWEDDDIDNGGVAQ